MSIEICRLKRTIYDVSTFWMSLFVIQHKKLLWVYTIHKPSYIFCPFLSYRYKKIKFLIDTFILLSFTKKSFRLCKYRLLLIYMTYLTCTSLFFSILVYTGDLPTPKKWWLGVLFHLIISPTPIQCPSGNLLVFQRTHTKKSNGSTGLQGLVLPQDTTWSLFFFTENELSS